METEPTGSPLWQFDDNFSVDSDTGFWKSAISYELGREMESKTIASAMGEHKPDFNSDGKKNRRDVWGKDKAAHPPGEILRANEQDAARVNAPSSKSPGGGVPLFFDYSSQDGRRSNECRNPHARLKSTGIRCVSIMKIARRGGFFGHPVIEHETTSGYIQSIRAKYTIPSTGCDIKHSIGNAGQSSNSSAPPRLRRWKKGRRIAMLLMKMCPRLICPAGKSEIRRVVFAPCYQRAAPLAQKW